MGTPSVKRRGRATPSEIKIRSTGRSKVELSRLTPRKAEIELGRGQEERLEILCRLGRGKVAVRQNHRHLRAAAAYNLRPMADCPVDDLAEAGLGIFKLPDIHS